MFCCRSESSHHFFLTHSSKQKQTTNLLIYLFPPGLDMAVMKCPFALTNEDEGVSSSSLHVCVQTSGEVKLLSSCSSQFRSRNSPLQPHSFFSLQLLASVRSGLKPVLQLFTRQRRRLSAISVFCLELHRPHLVHYWFSGLCAQHHWHVDLMKSVCSC